MVKELIILASLICPNTIIINKTKEWNKKDQATLERAQKRCGELYKNSPCLKRFFKLESTRYRAYCGEGK